MNVGDRIKQLRTEKNLTQPQLAEVIGIEQSYLSKLENDKSIPSADIFQAILKGLAMDVGTFLRGIDEAIIRGQLRQIPEVALYLSAQSSQRVHNIKKWLFSSALACILGLTLIVAGERSLIFNGVIYEYVSEGVLLPGEPAGYLSNWERYEPEVGCFTLEDSCLQKKAERARKKQQMETRLNSHTLLTDEYKGRLIYFNVEGGSRAYEQRAQFMNANPRNRYITLVGTLLFFSGVFGFFTEYRLRTI